MAIGDVEPVPDSTDLYYVDSGMYEVEKYGSVYLVDAERPALVDTGIAADREAVFGMLDEVGVDDLAYILPTHVHLDHAGGAGYLAERYPDATVMTHELGAPHLVDPSRLIEGTKAAVEDQWRFYDEPLPSRKTASKASPTATKSTSATGRSRSTTRPATRRIR